MIISKFNKATKTLLLLLIACIGFPVLMIEAEAYGMDIPCESSSKAYAVYLYNVEEDSTLFDKNSDKKISPASTVKLMTALVAYDNIENIDSFVTITEEMLGDAESNIMKLKVGENIRIKDIFAGLVCSGYNDAANALAVIAFGSVESFVEKMNARASALGASNTVYVDPTGIDDSAQTTARDTMLVAKEFMKRELLLRLSSTPSYEVPSTNLSGERDLHNRNAMISNHTGSRYLNSNANGMNAGMTGGGGYCVVTSMIKDDRTYICVVMGSIYDSDSQTTYSYVIANELLNYIDENLGYRILIEAEKEICKLPIVGANINTESVSVISANDIKVYLPADYTDSGLLKTSFVYFKEELTAPVSKGDTVGKIVISYDDEILMVSDIVVAEDVARDGFMYSLEFMKHFVTSRGFIAAVVCFAVLFLGYLFVYPKLRHRRRKRRNMSKYRYK